MNEARSETQKDVPGIEKVKQIFEATLPPYLPSQIINKDNLLRLKELQEQGYSSVIFYDHATARDPIQILKLILDNKLTRDKEICFPIEARLYNNSKLALEPIAGANKIKLCPIITQASLDWFDFQQKKKYEKAERSPKSNPDSLRKLEEKQRLKREKLTIEKNKYDRKYFKTVVDVIRKGGSAVIALQATRKEWFEMPPADEKSKVPPVVDTLMFYLDKAKLDKVAFLLIAPSIEGEINYKLEKTGFLNPHRKYIMKIGPTYTKDKLKEPTIETAHSEGDQSKRIRRPAGKNVYAAFNELVSPERKKPPVT